MTFKTIAAMLLACGSLVACAGHGDGGRGAGTANANTPAQAPSGVTASNGGGQRQLGDIPSVGITSGPAARGTTVGNVPNSKGASY